MEMTTEARKEAIRKFKERKPARGIYVVACSATNRKWVGSSRNLDATRNGLWFTLRLGGHPDKSLQQEWNIQSGNGFAFEVVESLAEDITAMSVADLLKEKAGLWSAQLGAPLLPPS